MNTKLLLTASAVVMGAAGIAGTFAPAEIANALQFGSPVVLQLLAALLFAFAMVNWMARGSLIGGIYNRPVAVGNLTHFLIGGLALIKIVAAGERRVAFLVATAIYIVFALGFAAVLFRSPVQRD
ncbi:MAG TPA: hypothetical protein VEK11_17105 [Thermoanaerobaculia bacterium]|nr:hypothetical protein [Thermoanaerobaculia bacterium]